jgi:hypothetical protein
MWLADGKYKERCPSFVSLGLNHCFNLSGTTFWNTCGQLQYRGLRNVVGCWLQRGSDTVHVRKFDRQTGMPRSEDVTLRSQLRLQTDSVPGVCSSSLHAVVRLRVLQSLVNGPLQRMGPIRILLPLNLKVLASAIRLCGRSSDPVKL